MTKNEINLDEVVEKKHNLKFEDQSFTFTNTSLFVLPMLNTTIIKLGKYFLNSFIKDAEYETLVERPLFLLFQYDFNEKDEKNFCKSIHSYLVSKKEFITYYYVGNINNNKCIMYLFDIDPEYDNDYKMFLNGKYSKFRPEFKERFPKYYLDRQTGRQVKTIINQVVNKSLVLKEYWEDKIDIKLSDEAEVWSRPNLEEIETL